MTYRFLTIAAACFVIPAFLFAQDEPKDEEENNMISNGSFETTEGKMKRTGNLEQATGWKSPTEVIADVFTETVAGAPISAPRNQFGDQSALDGINYAGVLWWSYQNKQPRSYMQAKFKKMLKKGEKYCVKYYISLADLSKYSTNEIGAYVSKVPVDKKDMNSLTYNAQVPLLKDQVYNDMFSWQGVCGIYEANGDEQYLIIGNFAANESTTNEKVKRPKGESRPQVMNAYYYIDDVSVTAVKNRSDCSCKQIDEAESEYIFSKRGAMARNLTPAAKVEQQVIYFKRFQQGIDRSMETWITDLVEAMKADSSITVKLNGFIDETEKARMAMRPDLETLGLERADTVKEALVEEGIDAARITTSAGPKDTPADDSGTETGESKNRRVEVDVVQ
ncbi:MAG: OmpA family protein [Flavobacteriales bacterium]|nr:OmpA family protein [Flavobacteriales bacterium]